MAARPSTPTTAVVAALAILALLPSCASNQGAPEAADLTGCYQFEWTEAARELGLPWGFDLLAGELTGWPNVPDGRVARTRVTESATRDHPFAFWRETEGDSIRVGHPGGGGFSLTLAPEGRALVGSARPVGDAVAFGEEFGPREPRPVVAHRVECPPVS